MKKWSAKKIFKTAWFGFGILFFIWNWFTFQSHNLPKNTFENSAQVTVKITDDQVSFQPVTAANTLEVIFFQGGMTAPKAYGPFCRKLAENGFACHLIKMDWVLHIPGILIFRT